MRSKSCSRNLFLALNVFDVDMWTQTGVAQKKNWVRYLSVEYN